MTIKESIQHLCQENKMSISKLEKELGFGNRTIGKWDKAAPSVDKLIKVANYFHVSLDWLTGLDEFNKPQPPELTRLIRAAEKLTPEQIELLTELSRQLGDKP